MRKTGNSNAGQQDIIAPVGWTPGSCDEGAWLDCETESFSVRISSCRRADYGGTRGGARREQLNNAAWDWWEKCRDRGTSLTRRARARGSKPAWHPLPFSLLRQNKPTLFT